MNDNNSSFTNEDGSKKRTVGFGTRVINAKFGKPDAHGALNMPVYRNASFEFADSATIAQAFQFRRDLHTYSRISNPTVENFEAKIKAASGAESVAAKASGMAAISTALFAVSYAGANIVASPHIFGNTFSFLNSTLAQFGVEVRFVNADNHDEIAAAVDENTCAFFAEVVTNPHLEIADFPKISKLLHEKNVPLVIDTTLVPWCAFDAKAAGIDIEVVSTTKYVSNGATSIGGAIVDYGTFGWRANKKLGVLPKPKGMSRFMFKLRSELIQNLGTYMSADTAYLQASGMDSLELRFTRMSQSAYSLASHFAGHSKVVSANYPKLASSPYREISDRLFSGNPGAMFTLSLGSEKACFTFMDALKTVRRATNIFDHKTLVIHPYSTIYGVFSADMKKLMGIPDNLLRFSAGLEDFEDIAEDIERGLAAI